VALDAVGPRSPAEDLMGIEGRGRQEPCLAREVERVGVPLEGEDLARKPCKSGSPTAASVRVPGSPNLGSAPRQTRRRGLPRGAALRNKRRRRERLFAPRRLALASRNDLKSGEPKPDSNRGPLHCEGKTSEFITS
jgi:hypothetical protein